MVTPVSKNQDAVAKWTAIFAVVGLAIGVMGRWEEAKGFVEWTIFNLTVLAKVHTLRVGFFSILGGTLFALFWPWVLPGRMTSQRAQTSIRFLSALFTFFLAVVQDPDRGGMITGLLCMFGGPMVGMAIVRRLCKANLPVPKSLQSTSDENLPSAPASGIPGNGANASGSIAP
jgi:hypothetical protein